WFEIVGVGVDAERIVAGRVHVVEQTHVDGDAFGHRAGPTAVNVELEFAEGRSALDRRPPGPDVESAGRGQVDPALEREIAARQRYAAKAIVGGDGNVARDRDGRLGRFILGKYGSCQHDGASSESCGQRAADGRKHDQFPLNWGELLLLRPTCVSRSALLIRGSSAMRR